MPEARERATLLTNGAATAALATETRLRNAFERGLGVPFTSTNRVERLLNGRQIFPAMLEAIESAQRSVNLLTFVYWRGAIARRFAAALAQRARTGVRVQVLLDAVGCLPMSQELVDVMTRAGADVRRFRPPSRLLRVGNRTHRKVLVCDQTTGFTGGVGIAEEWEGDARDPSEWRDSHFRVEGPAVAGLEAAFFENWTEGGGALPADGAATEYGTPGTSSVQVLRSSGGAPWDDACTAAGLLLTAARERLRIATAYFVPEERLTESLVGARERGVDVEIMLPGEHTDHRLCNLAGRRSFEALLEAGIELWIYQRTMLHAKVITVDSALSFVGSPNFNQRSLRRDDEVALVIADPAVTRVLDEDFDRDRRSCDALDPARWPRRGAWSRVKEACAGVLSSRL